MSGHPKKLPEKYIRERIEQGESVDDLAKEYGTFRSRIRRICGIQPDKVLTAPAPVKEKDEKFYPVNITMTEGALDKLIGMFTPEEKAIALEAVLCSRVG